MHGLLVNGVITRSAIMKEVLDRATQAGFKDSHICGETV